MKFITTTIFAVMLAAIAAPATIAQENAEEEIRPGLLAAGGFLDHPDPDVVLSLGLGASYRTAYPGSSELKFGPSFLFIPDYIRFKNGFEFGSGRSVGFREGFGIRGAFRLISARRAKDYPELSGLEDEDWSAELGLGIGYEQRSYRVFGDLRYGFIGHNGWVGQLGADLISRPLTGLTLTLGPRLDVGDDKFMNTYFGVSRAEAASSQFAAYDASAGIVSAGIEAAAIYQMNERWGVQGKVIWNHLKGDAAKSPITQLGSKDQYKVQLTLTRRISIDF
jgi:outer membrane scaffolding protein for murein synthesis (MipA/OmpV family)